MKKYIPKQGWAVPNFPSLANKQHYFIEGVNDSLCRKYPNMGYKTYDSDDEGFSCKKCLRTLKSLTEDDEHDRDQRPT